MIKTVFFLLLQMDALLSLRIMYDLNVRIYACNDLCCVNGLSLFTFYRKFGTLLLLL